MDSEGKVQGKRILILMRHAKSDWSQPNLADHDRALNPRGRRAAPLMARQLLDHQWEPELVLASTAIRVQETLELMRNVDWASQAKVEDHKQLYLATPKQIVASIESQPDTIQSIMAIGHNPGMQSLVSNVAGQDLEMPTAAVAVFASEGPGWHKSFFRGDWRLVAHWKPRELE